MTYYHGENFNHGQIRVQIEKTRDEVSLLKLQEVSLLDNTFEASPPLYYLQYKIHQHGGLC